MSIAAFCPVGSLATVNANLDAAGFGPNNFSVPVYDGNARVTHATMHSFFDTQAFRDALNAEPSVTSLTYVEGTAVPRDKVKELVVTNNGLAWPDDAPILPESGTINPGEYYKYQRGLEIEFWVVIQQFNRNSFGGDPNQYPSLIRQARVPGQIAPWAQPIDQFDAYLTIDPFTGEGERVTHNGSTWLCTDGSAGGPGGSLINTWTPGDFGWTQV